MSGSTSLQAQPNGRQKKNSIGSWFQKKFGRRPSDAAPSQSPNQATASGSVPARKGARNESDDRGKAATLPNVNGGARGGSATGTNTANGAQQPQFASAFTSNQAHGLANTLTVPSSEAPAQGRLTPPPQLDGIPTQEPLGAIDLPRLPRPDMGSVLTDQEAGTLSPSTVTNVKPLEPPVSGENDLAMHTGATPTSESAAAPPIPGAILSHAPIAQERAEPESDDESSFAGRDSIGNRTMDTSKSRASTKPTTLMSMETREAAILPTTHIAGHRQSGGDDSFGTSPRLSTGPREGSAIQFASNSVSRSGSGQIINSGSVTGEGGSTFINVPTHSRHHPNNNPHPSAIPADNASVLTLASSTAGMSLGGASRGHYHAPSLGGARSIGGSLMGDRRNSSDTYASLKALPPLSRRGSDSSSRTRDSIAASSTGQNSQQAMYPPSGTFAGPGAPSDRVSLHRTPSQKTVATQLSVPLSTSASNPALQAYAKSEHATNGSQSQLISAQPSHTTAEPEFGEHQQHEARPTDNQAEDPKEAVATSVEPSASTDLVDPQLAASAPSHELLEAQASHLAATEHDETLHKAAVEASRDVGSAEESLEVRQEEPFDVPGGPPVA